MVARVLIFILAILGCSASAMVGGSELTRDQRKSFGALFGVTLSYLGDVPGMAVHIGDGLLLTAWHVPNGLPLLQLVSLTDIDGNVLTSADVADARVISPNAKEYVTTSNMFIQLPDIAIIVLPENLRNAIRKYPE